LSVRHQPRRPCQVDFIAEHYSGKLTIGVEVKNTISVLDKKEVDLQKGRSRKGDCDEKAETGLDLAFTLAITGS
jgi:hypothetical protein